MQKKPHFTMKPWRNINLPCRFVSLILSIFLLNAPKLDAQILSALEENRNLSYDEVIAAFKCLDEYFPGTRFTEAGNTDVGKPLHLFVIDGSGNFTPGEVKENHKGVLFINNAIHPGEACGIEASIMFIRELLDNRDQYEEFLDRWCICIVPVFNVGGYLNRSPLYRLNQEGPVDHGFRGNARDIDLNRDFIKLDTENTRSLVKLLRQWDPDVFIDTHTTNGSDHQYSLTLMPAQYKKLPPELAALMKEKLQPALYSFMQTGPYELIPYVVYNRTPEQGILATDDPPRYAIGYASLFNSLSFITEAHSHKPYRDRVLSTYEFFRAMAHALPPLTDEIRKGRTEANKTIPPDLQYTLEWEVDTTVYEKILFKGYEIAFREGELTGRRNLYFDRNKPYEKLINYYPAYKPARTVQAAPYYIIPRAWREVIERLHINRVQMYRFPGDTLLELEAYYVTDYKTAERPYNGRYFHYDVSVKKVKDSIQLYAGDYIVPLAQPAAKYIVQVLEPEGPDSFFAWNFMDEILSRKEYFSPGNFETTALRLLDSIPGLREEFEECLRGDPEFAESSHGQLNMIYSRSSYLEKTYMRVPVYRALNDFVIPKNSMAHE